MKVLVFSCLLLQQMKTDIHKVASFCGTGDISVGRAAGLGEAV